MTTNYTSLIQKYRAQRNPPRGSTAQVPMPTGATTGASFPLPPSPQPAAPVVQATPRYAPPVVGNLVLPWRTMFFAILLLCGAALLLIAILDGDVRLFQSQMPTAAPTTAPPVVYVERVVTATAMPTDPPPQVIVVTAPPPAYVPPVRPQPQSVQRQAVRSLPAPTQAPPAAWPAPARQTTRAVYVCADGAQFPQEDSRWAWGPFGQWHMEGSGDVVDIRDSLENNAQMGWHYKCRREWR